MCDMERRGRHKCRPYTFVARRERMKPAGYITLSERKAGMRTRLSIVGGFFVALILASVAPAAEEKTIQLFNGKDLSGWTWVADDKHKDVKMEDVWSVNDEGIVHCVGKPA